MAFVLVQHLDPDHESSLAQILGRTTEIQVCEVRDRMKVLPDRIYVIPPNVCMEIVKGVLKLRPREKRPGAARSIDVFLESLAQDQQQRAIGVVLSGTAMDGTLGLEMIKAEGGITFAQDESAKYASMPRSAIAAGCVDFVLSPDGIARELARIAEHPWVAAAQSTPVRNGSKGKAFRATTAKASPTAATHAQEESSYKNILLLLQNHRGVDFSRYKSNTIERRINRRMVLNRQQKLGDYAAFLKNNPKELDPLYSDLLINVTSFFRNPDAFEALKAKVFPRLLQLQGENDPVRVWTLGCSTGQEAYSLAMAYTEYCDKISRAPKLQLFATDLNESHLERARTGLYSRNMVADLSSERLKRFFAEEQGGLRVNKSIRELCVFARHNILSDPPFSRMNLVTCRNLLIYLEPESQKRILPNLHFALKPGGFLMLGASESVGSFTSLFEPAGTREKIFLKKAATLLALPMAVTKSHPADKKGGTVSKPAAPPEQFRTELTAQREADRFMATYLAPPSVLITDSMQILQFRGSTKAFLEPPTGKATFDLFKMTPAGLMLPLRAAINEARKKNQPVCRKNVGLQDGDKSKRVTIEVVPLKNLKERHFLILFHKVGPGKNQLRTTDDPPSTAAHSLGKPGLNRIRDLEHELAEARDYVQSLQEQHEATTEEVQASSEEVQSANEELQSINEELETSKEELESANEELTTVNEELASRNAELNRVNSDLNNLQTSTRLPIVLLSRDLCIRHFTPQAEKQFNLVAGDVGRPFSKVRHDLDLPKIEQFIAEVIAQVREQECEVRDQHGGWHLLYVRPYINSDNKVDGAVLVLMDIDARKRSEQAVASALDFAEAILRTARDPFLILDASLRIERANEAFYSTFQVKPAEVMGRTVFELDHGHWNVPKLRELLQDILPRHSFFNSFEVTTKFEKIGYRTMLLNARTLSDRKWSTRPDFTRHSGHHRVVALPGTDAPIGITLSPPF